MIRLSELWCLFLYHQYHDWYSVVVSIWSGAFHARFNPPKTADVFSEYRRSSGYGVGISRGRLCVDGLSSPPSQLNPRETVFTMMIGLAMAGSELNACVNTCVNSLQRSVAPTPQAVVHISGQPCFQPPRGHLSLHGSVVGLISSVRSL